MDLSLGQDMVRFRQEVRDFMRTDLPDDIRAAARRQFHIAPDMMRRWQRILHARGWAAPGWPVEDGGTGWSALQRYVFDQEYYAADGPSPLQMGHGVQIIGPVLYTYGSPRQKAHYLPRILRGEDYWAQGFSEPGAGSDLASLRTTAVRDGDSWVINGHKIWTSLAHHANMVFLLARTDPDVKPQRGISFFVFPIDTPGVTVRPIISIDRGHSLNETFYDEVRVPVDSLIGEEGQGWSYAKFLLGHERFNIAEIARTKRRLERLRLIAAQMSSDAGGTLADDPIFRNKVTALDIELVALEQLGLRVAWEMDQKIANMQSASILKLRGTRLLQSANALAVEAMGYTALPYAATQDGAQLSPPAPDEAQGRMEEHLFLRSATIYGGTSETQLNILSNLIFAGA